MCGISVRPKKHGHLSAISYRGPDTTVKKSIQEYDFIFHRLAIIDTSHAGDQPFETDRFILVCNGEIYNYKQLKKIYCNYPYISHSDCEVILPLLEHLSLKDLCNSMDGEFAFVVYDKQKKCLLAGRDPMGIRPLFYGYTSDGLLSFASEMKDLIGICAKVEPVKPGYFFDGNEFIPYARLYDNASGEHTDLVNIFNSIRTKLEEAVTKRLNADVPIGYLLSGGLDSSLVCAIAQKYSTRPISTFAIGLDHGPIDLKYAKQVATFLKTDHHEIIFTEKDINNILRTIIWHTETWDVTTIRASIPMYLLCNYIRKQTPIRVLLTGEVSDELFGYKYTDYAPDAMEFQKESQKRIKELYMYDVLRADRCIAANGLEARVPFSDKYFVDYVMSIDPRLKLNTYKMGKYLLRQSFANMKYLPEEILWRDKAAFSDAVGHGLADTLIGLAQRKYSDQEFAERSTQYSINPPLSKEGLLYREIFNEMYPGQDHVICGYWLPNRKWPNCNIIDPSARHLPNYGASGK